MKSLWKKLFGLTETQEKTITLLTQALSKKKYKIKENEFFYDDGEHHSLSVEIFLSPELTIWVDTLFVTKEFMAFNPLTDSKPAWVPEISSSKAYNLVLDHFENLLLIQEQKKKLAYKNQQNKLVNLVNKT